MSPYRAQFIFELAMAVVVIGALVFWAWFWTGPELQWERDLASRPVPAQHPEGPEQ